MIKYCPFDERYRCYVWIDNEALRCAQEESVELFQENWNEIVHLLERVRTLEDYIRSTGGTIPPEDPDNDG